MISIVTCARICDPKSPSKVPNPLHQVGRFSFNKNQKSSFFDDVTGRKPHNLFLEKDQAVQFERSKEMD